MISRPLLRRSSLLNNVRFVSGHRFSDAVTGAESGSEFHLRPLVRQPNSAYLTTLLERRAATKDTANRGKAPPRLFL